MPTLLLIRRYSQSDEGTADGGSEGRRAVAVFDQVVSDAAIPGSVVSSVAAPFLVPSTKDRGRRKKEHRVVRTEPVAGAGVAGKEGSRKRAAVLLDDGADHAGALVSAAAREPKLGQRSWEQGARSAGGWALGTPNGAGVRA